MHGASTDWIHVQQQQDRKVMVMAIDISEEL
jgi:hypothetical protein